MRMARAVREIPLNANNCYMCGATSSRFTPVREVLPKRREGLTLHEGTAFVPFCPDCYQRHPQSKKDEIKRLEGSKKKEANRARNKLARRARR